MSNTKFHYGTVHMFGTKTGDDDANIWLRPAPGQTLNIEANLVDPLGAVLTNLSITETTESTTKTTGALIVAGGIGTSKNINCSNLTASGTVNCSILTATEVAGTWAGDIIDSTLGGTGADNNGNTIVIGGNFSTTDQVTIGSTSTANRLMYTSAANTIGPLTTGNNGVLITGGTGIPSISSTIPTATQDNITRTGTITSGTWSATNIGLSKGGTGSALNATNGTVLCVASGVGAQTAAGSTGQFMLSAGTGVPTWSNTVPNAITVSNATASSSVSTGSIINSGGIGNTGRIFTNDLTCVNSIAGKSIYATISQVSTLSVATSTGVEVLASSNGTFTNTSGGFTYNSTTGRLTVSETGNYHVVFSAWFADVSTTTYTDVAIDIHGGSNISTNRKLGIGSGHIPTSCSSIIALTAGNVLKFTVVHTHGSNRDIYGGTVRIAKVVA